MGARRTCGEPGQIESTTISLKLYGSRQVPWRWGTAVEDTIRGYLDMRATLQPSLVAGGHETTATGFPITARCDLTHPTPTRRCSTKGVMAVNPASFASPHVRPMPHGGVPYVW